MPQYTALSLGAGVQSSVLALLLDKHRTGGSYRLDKLGYDRPDIAIFADTKWEPRYIYKHLEWLQGELSLPVEILSEGDLSKNLPKGLTCSGNRFVDVPLYTVNEDGGKGRLVRQCTNHYKIKPITRRIRKLAGGKAGRPFPRDVTVEMLLGLSIDEASRIKPSREKWIKHRYPLIELGMSRDDCIAWFEEHYPGRHLPRSACVICPFRSDAHWLEMKKHDPDSFEEAVRFDRSLRRHGRRHPVRRILSGRPYLHKSRTPLDSAVVTFEAKVPPVTINHFQEECEGLCGV